MSSSVAFSSHSPISPADEYSPRMPLLPFQERMPIMENPKPVLYPQVKKTNLEEDWEELEPDEKPLPVMARDRNPSQPTIKRTKPKPPHPSQQTVKKTPPPLVINEEEEGDYDLRPTRTKKKGCTSAGCGDATGLCFSAVVFGILSFLSLFFLILSKQSQLVNIGLVIFLLIWDVVFGWLIIWFCRRNRMVGAWVTFFVGLAGIAILLGVACGYKPPQ